MQDWPLACIEYKLQHETFEILAVEAAQESHHAKCSSLERSTPFRWNWQATIGSDILRSLRCDVTLRIVNLAELPTKYVAPLHSHDIAAIHRNCPYIVNRLDESLQAPDIVFSYAIG
jgi:hypothetical protein